METTLPILLADSLEASEETRARAIRAGRRESTVRTYGSHWDDFERWCHAQGVRPLPATSETLCEYLLSQAAEGKSLATIQARRTAVGVIHKAAGLPSPARGDLVRDLVADLSSVAPGNPRRSIGKEPVSLADLRAYMSTLNGDLRATRDRALLVVGFAGAFRRSELAAMTVENLREDAKGITVHIAVHKTGEDAFKFLPYGEHPETCPVRLLRAWLSASKISSGPIWRAVSDGGAVRSTALRPAAVAEIVKRCAVALGKDPDRFGGHSLRSGFVTQAIDNGADLVAVAKQTGHRSQSVLLGYYRSRAANVNNAVSALGL